MNPATYLQIADSDALHYCRFGEAGPWIFLVHGGGQTCESWRLVGRRLGQRARVVAMDLRGHGLSRCADSADLTADRLVGDLVAFVNQMRNEERDPTGPTVLVGHSMGGALVAKAASSGTVSGLQGVIVVDAVEGFALAGLPHMRNFVAQFPTGFGSEAEAISWALRKGILKNSESAALSVPSQLRPDGNGWVWRVDLLETEPFWDGWFRGMTAAFLQAPCAKVLIVTGTERLDKELMIAQMQGKFQFHVVPKAGHVVMEDQPEQVLEILSNFLVRHRLIAEQISGCIPTLMPSC